MTTEQKSYLRNFAFGALYILAAWLVASIVLR